MIRKVPFLKLKRKEWLSIGLLALFSIYLTNILEFWALQYLSAAKACFIYSFSPFFTALFSYLYFGEKINFTKACGLGIGFLGILPVILFQTGEEILKEGRFFSWPILAVVGAALCSVYGWVLLRLVVKNQMISPLLANGMSMIIGGIMAMIHSFFTEPWTPLPVEQGGFIPFFAWTAVIALISNVICYNLYGMLLKRLTATLLSFVGTFSPIFASIHGWLFLNEPFSWVIVISTAIVCLGLWMVYSTELKQGYYTPAT